MKDIAATTLVIAKYLKKCANMTSRSFLSWTGTRVASGCLKVPIMKLLFCLMSLEDAAAEKSSWPADQLNGLPGIESWHQMVPPRASAFGAR